MRVLAQAPAKVNLSLLVGSRRPDGYHELFTVFAAVDLYDELAFSLTVGPPSDRPGTIVLECPGIDGEDNLALRALRAVEAAGGRAISGELTIGKRIPVAAGLGGGSSDAAVALELGARVLEEEGGVRLGPEKLLELARDLGADVPFFFGCREAGAALARGTGDRLEPLLLPPLHLVLVLSRGELSTPEVYAAFDRMAGRVAPESFARRAKAGETQWRNVARRWAGAELDAVEAARAVAGLLKNDLEPAGFSLAPLLRRARDSLQADPELGALGVLMSGSGPTLFAVFGSEEEAQAAVGRLEAQRYTARAARILAEGW